MGNHQSKTVISGAVGSETMKVGCRDDVQLGFLKVLKVV
jgi:hypothetical protein